MEAANAASRKVVQLAPEDVFGQKIRTLYLYGPLSFERFLTGSKLHDQSPNLGMK